MEQLASSWRHIWKYKNKLSIYRRCRGAYASSSLHGFLSSSTAILPTVTFVLVVDLFYFCLPTVFYRPDSFTVDYIAPRMKTVNEFSFFFLHWLLSALQQGPRLWIWCANYLDKCKFIFTKNIWSMKNSTERLNNSLFSVPMDFHITTFSVQLALCLSY